MKNKILVITRYLRQHGPAHGGSIVAGRNLLFLQHIYGSSNVDIAHVDRPNILQRLLNFLFQSSYGDCRKVNKVLSSYDFESCRFVFIDGSLEGATVKFLHQKKVPVIVFYHNIEQKYYQDYCDTQPGIGTWVMKKYATHQEKLSTLYATYRIALNQRDAAMMKEKYGKEADCILPTSFDDPGRPVPADSAKKPYVLFIGSNFFANSDGIRWFIENVLPRIKYDLHVAGSVSDSLGDLVESRKYPNLKVLGFVNDLRELYRNAVCVVSPIFAGSGLKTKSIEALMYGKNFLGTDEAFQGIEADYSRIGGKCNTAAEFIEKINAMDMNDYKSSVNLYSYEFFLEHFSTEQVQNNFMSFLHKNKTE